MNKTATKEKTIPAATFSGTYSTYENSKQRSFNKRLGNVVDFVIENTAVVELGAWRSGVKIRTLPGTTVNTTTKQDGTTSILISRK